MATPLTSRALASLRTSLCACSRSTGRPTTPSTRRRCSDAFCRTTQIDAATMPRSRLRPRPSSRTTATSRAGTPRSPRQKSRRSAPASPIPDRSASSRYRPAPRSASPGGRPTRDRGYRCCIVLYSRNSRRAPAVSRRCARCTRALLAKLSGALVTARRHGATQASRSARSPRALLLARLLGSSVLSDSSA